MMREGRLTNCSNNEAKYGFRECFAGAQSNKNLENVKSAIIFFAQIRRFFLHSS